MVCACWGMHACWSIAGCATNEMLVSLLACCNTPCLLYMTGFGTLHTVSAVMVTADNEQAMLSSR
jgi:hypothetical protein